MPNGRYDKALRGARAPTRDATGSRARASSTSTILGSGPTASFATLQDARANGLEGVVGSLTPGKKADVLLFAAEDLNNMPLKDPVGTVVRLGIRRRDNGEHVTSVVPITRDKIKIESVLGVYRHADN